MSEFSDKVKSMGITFDFFHVMCKMREVDGTAMKYPEDLWYISVTWNDKVFHGEFTTRTGARVMDRSVTKERGGFYSKSGDKFYKSEAELIKAGLLVLPNQARSALSLEANKRKREELMWKLGCDFLHSSLSDAAGTVESFKNWATSYGYNPDSLSALQIYLKCQETNDKLLRMFGGKVMEELVEAGRDY